MTDLLTTTEAARYVGLHPQRLRAYLASGQGPVTALRHGRGPGHARHFRLEDLDAWLASRPRPRKRKRVAVDETATL